MISPTAVASRHITSRETTPKLPKFLSLCVSLYIYTSTRLPEFPQKYSEVSSKLLFPYPTHFLHNPTTTHAHHLFHLCFYLREQYRCPPRLQSLIIFPSSSPQSQLVVRSQEFHSPPPTQRPPPVSALLIHLDQGLQTTTALGHTQPTTWVCK